MTSLRWDLDLAAPMDEVWAVMADTDAFNRRAGLGFRFARVGDELRGEVRVAGIRTTWRERPFEVVAPRKFTSRRVYDGGPVREAFTFCELTEHASGTRVHYRVDLVPSSAVARLALPALAQFQLRPTLDRQLKAVPDLVFGKVPHDPPKALTADAARLLDDALAGTSPPAAQALRERLLHAPRLVQDRLRPLQIAAQSGVSVDDIVEACLVAVERGALVQTYSLVCPQCREPQDEAREISIEPQQAHCVACGITWTAAIVDQVEVVFRASRRLRPDPVTVDCAMSPARSPHLLARVELAPGGEVEIELKMREGAYKLEGGGEVGLVEVVAGAPSRAVILVGRDTLRPKQLTLGPGPVTLRIRSTSDRAEAFGVVERWRPPFVLSAPAFLDLAPVRARMSTIKLGAGLSPTIEQAWAVAVTGASAMVDDLAASLGDQPRVWRRGKDMVVSVHPDAGAALDLVEDAVRFARPVSAGIASGHVTLLRHADGRSAAGGLAVDRAVDAALHLGVPRVAVHADSRQSPELDAALMARVGRVKESPNGVLVFGSMLDFATPSLLLRRTETGSPTTMPWDALPEQIGRYVVLKEIGRGGMGVVFECLEPSTARRLAVKALLQPMAPGQERLVQRFFNEAWYASRIRHPNVVEFLDFGLEDEQPWIAMERLIGQTLAAELRRHLSPGRVTEVLLAVCDALEAIHAQGLVHRDLKPANVFVVDDPKVPGGVKLLDFGLVRRAGTHRSDGVAGTPDYVSPEQLVGDALGPQADVYSLGVMAFRMLTGRLPVSGTVPERVLSRVGLDPATLTALDEFGPLGDVIRRALAPDPADRPASGAAMRALLDGAFR